MQMGHDLKICTWLGDPSILATKDTNDFHRLLLLKAVLDNRYINLYWLDMMFLCIDKFSTDNTIIISIMALMEMVQKIPILVKKGNKNPLP